MPELPEIETVKRGIEPFVLGKIIKQVIVRNSRLRQSITSGLSELLTSQRIKKITRRGKYLFSKIKQRKAAIKLLLMDSKIVAGIGNIYANEILFNAKIHPLVLGKDLSKKQCNVLVRAAKKVLIDAIKAGGTSIKDYRQADGKLGNFQLKLFVYGRQNLPCRICQTILQNIRLGQRTTVFCPRCQEIN